MQRLQPLADEPYTRKLLAEVAQCQADGEAGRSAEIAGSVRERLFDLSRFMQEFKHKFSLWFNSRHERRGTVWEERFKSVLVEGAGQSAQGPGGLAAVAAY
ncbi:MAG TPA: hypothetical protein VMN36_02110, partial [Verrucomicrobiales bacterium]|nr:hypothetical protein [Verrucomicrobiales bacterium]